MLRLCLWISWQFKSNSVTDPLLYDSLVRQFQTPAEREAEGRAKGYSRVLEGSLLRGEARLEAMAKTYVPGDSSESYNPEASARSSVRSQQNTTFSVEADLAPKPETKAEARERWEEFLRDRFIHGKDEDFEYAKVDENDEFDVLERKDQEEAWFDDEDPEWVTDKGDQEEDESGVGGRRERKIEGQTGIQDF